MNPIPYSKLKLKHQVKISYEHIYFILEKVFQKGIFFFHSKTSEVKKLLIDMMYVLYAKTNL